MKVDMSLNKNIQAKDDVSMCKCFYVIYVGKENNTRENAYVNLNSVNLEIIIVL